MIQMYPRYNSSQRLGRVGRYSRRRESAWWRDDGRRILLSARDEIDRAIESVKRDVWAEWFERHRHVLARHREKCVGCAVCQRLLLRPENRRLRANANPPW